MDWVFYSRSNQEMVDKFTRLGIIESSEVERAFRCVSRAAFVPDDLLDDAFKDTPLRGSHNVHLSAPHMYATILEELELDVGMTFLNVGSGTGYFSTLAGYIIKKDGINHGIELHEDLVKFANDRIAAFLGNGPPDSKDICTPVLIAGNACRLDPEQIKYDRLYCGAACSQSNVKFLLKMVKVGGFLIAPVGSRLIKLNRVSLKEGRQSVINDVSFAPLQDASAEEMKLPKLRFPDSYSKKSRKNSVSCDVSFPISKNPCRKLLTKIRAYQDALDCVQAGQPLPMPYCYVPCFEDLWKAKGKQKRGKTDMAAPVNDRKTETNMDTSTVTTENRGLDHSAVDSQIEFFSGPSQSSPSEFSKDVPLAESSGKLDSSSPAKKKAGDVDWDFLSTNRTWLEVLEHYYSLCATTEARRNECVNIKVENSDSISDQLKILTFKKYAKQMGLLPSKSRKKSTKGDAKTDSKGDAPVVEEVANDIVENLLEEVISQVDENDLAENFLAAVTGTGPFANSDIRRRSSVARAIILDNLPRLRASAEETVKLSPTLQTLIRSFDDEDKSHDRSDSSEEGVNDSQSRDEVSHKDKLLDMQVFVNNVIADIDRQVLQDIVNDASKEGFHLEEDAILESRAQASGELTQSEVLRTCVLSLAHLKELSSGGGTSASAYMAPENPNDACCGKTDEQIEVSHAKNDPLLACQGEESCDPLEKLRHEKEGNFIVETKSEQVFVKKDTVSYSEGLEDYLELQKCPRTSDRSTLSSFTPSNSLQKSDQSQLILLEQKNAMMKEKGVASINSNFVEERWKDCLPPSHLLTLPPPHLLMSSVRTDAMGAEKWKEHLSCTGSPPLTQGDSFTNCLPSYAEKDSCCVRDSCLIKSTESTPNSPSAFFGKPQNFDLQQTGLLPDSAGVEELSFDGTTEPLAQLKGNLLHGSPIGDNIVENMGARSFLIASESYDSPTTCPTLSDSSHVAAKTSSIDERCEYATASSVLDNVADAADMSSLAVNKIDSSLTEQSTPSFLDMEENNSLIASTPVHTAASAASEVCNRRDEICKESDSEISSDAIGRVISKEVVRMKSELHPEKSRGSKIPIPPFTTHYTASFKKKRRLRKAFMTIKMDVPSSKVLRSLPSKDWSLKHDKELVLYLSRKEKMSGHVAFSNCCVNIIDPTCFVSSDLLQYKHICSCPADALARRGIVLKRLAEVLDSVMNMLVGPSLMRDQLKTPFSKDYSSQSFNESSFESSGIPLNLDSLMPTEKADQPSEKGKETRSDEAAASATPHCKDVMEAVQTMMHKEIENVRRKKSIARAKLDLYNDLSAEYEEQIKLIKEQVGLVEEQQQLLQSRLRGGSQYENWRQSLQQTEQMMQERKLHRKHILEQLAAIKEQEKQKLAERDSVLQVYKQLAKVEKRLVEERAKSTTMGQHYLEDKNGKLKILTQCVEKCSQIFDKLSGIGTVSGKDVVTEDAPISDSEEDANDLEPTKEAGRSKYRYHPHLLLAKSRFLFPLTSKRICLIKELLRISETDSLHPCNVAKIDRRVPLKERHKYPPSNTVFMQMFNALKNKELDFREAKRHFEKLWEVKFIGEGIIDQGGGFRDSLAEMAEELCPASPDIKECLNFFIKTPNQKNGIGDHRDAYIPNPSCKDYHIYTWLGKIIGSAFRTDETFPLAFPPFIWKLLIGDIVTWAGDYVGVDETVVRVTDGTELLPEDVYNKLYGLDQTYTIVLSDGTEQEAIPNGTEIPVKPSERAEYAKLVRKTRMMESEKQVKAMRDGLLAVVPEALLSCLTWQDFERGVCGSPEITVHDLKANCRYELDLSPTVDCVSFLWEALTAFTSEERSKFIRFVTGRRRLPSPFFISRCSSNDQHLPSASTCGCNLFLPSYTDAKVAAEKIRYAINNCVSIDTDTSPW